MESRRRALLGVERRDRYDFRNVIKSSRNCATEVNSMPDRLTRMYLDRVDEVITYMIDLQAIDIARAEEDFEDLSCEKIGKDELRKKRRGVTDSGPQDYCRGG